MYRIAASAPPSTCARVIANSITVLYTNPAAEPIAISVSMLGAPCIRLVKPLVKNFLLISITTAASSS